MAVMTATRSADPSSVEDLVGTFGDGCRYEIVGGSLLVTRDEPFTLDDVEALPDDVRRYELLDGVLLVTPAPVLAHQRVLFALARLLHAACPPDLEVVLCAGYNPAPHRSYIPDLFIAPRAELTGKYLTVAPVLAVEIASPSTARIDRKHKREAYEARGVESYWMLDPRRLTVTVLELRDGGYAEIATRVTEVVVERPFPLRLVPAELAAE